MDSFNHGYHFSLLMIKKYFLTSLSYPFKVSLMPFGIGQHQMVYVFIPRNIKVFHSLTKCRISCLDLDQTYCYLKKKLWRRWVYSHIKFYWNIHTNNNFAKCMGALNCLRWKITGFPLVSEKSFYNFLWNPLSWYLDLLHVCAMSNTQKFQTHVRRMSNIPDPSF